MELQFQVGVTPIEPQISPYTNLKYFVPKKGFQL